MPRTRSIAWSELKLGIIGVIALVLTTSLVFAIGGEGGFWNEKYPLKTRFTDVQGLKAGAVVRLNGKEIGQVTAVEFAGPAIEVSMEILTDVRPLITNESTATVGSLSLLGEPIIDIRSTGGGVPLADWAYVPAGGPGGPFGELTASAQESLDQTAQLLADLRAGRGTLGKLVTDDQLYLELNRFVSSAKGVTDAINRGQGTIGGLMKDPAAYQALKTSMQNLETMTTRINSGQGALGRLLNDEATGRSMAGMIDNLEQVTARMSSGPGTMSRLLNESELHDRLTGTLNRIDQVVAGLEQGKGTAGQLLQNQQLYETINSTFAELRSLLSDVRADPKKYLRVSVSIF
jgi:phospholipid/cholesterol/gamma-HCH transport system substrate-binding protein